MSSQLRYLYFVGPGDRLPNPLENALIRELPDLAVHITNDWGGLVRRADSDGVCPNLILIDEAYGVANATSLREFQETYPNTGLCLTFNGDYHSKQYIRECLKTGVIHNILPMNLRLDLWLFAVQIMLHGGSYMPPDLVELLEIDRNLQIEKTRKADESTVNGDSAVGALTPREREVLALIAQGKQNKMIAAQLSLSEHTIKLHIHHIISKMGVSNRTEAAAAFFQIHEAEERRRLER
jgi:DNA-binding NarL/FixJ family response regulator